MASLRMLQSFRTATAAPDVEVVVRDTVAAALGVAWDRLGPDTVLADDLAVDSLDLLTLGVAFEEAFEIVLAPRTLGSVRTYNDLVDAVEDAIASRDEASDGVLVRARLVGPPPAPEPIFERTLPLSSYTADVIVDETLGAGPGSTLVLTILTTREELSLGWLKRIFPRLDGRGVRLSVRLEQREPVAVQVPVQPAPTPPLTLVPSGLRVTRPAGG
jgi:acyl carrier protein